MKDLDKLEQIYDLIDKTLTDIEDIGELSDYDLDYEVDKIYSTIDNEHTYLYGLIKEIQTGESRYL